MEVRLAEHLGMCFRGPRRHRPGPGLARAAVTILGDLVHNDEVVRSWKPPASAACPAGGRDHNPSVLLTAHGTSRRRQLQLHRRAFVTHDAACPLVRSHGRRGWWTKAGIRW